MPISIKLTNEKIPIITLLAFGGFLFFLISLTHSENKKTFNKILKYNTLGKPKVVLTVTPVTSTEQILW
jgi:hypothetical protein